jgi:hypothetical protein
MVIINEKDKEFLSLYLFSSFYLREQIEDSIKEFCYVCDFVDIRKEPLSQTRQVLVEFIIIKLSQIIGTTNSDDTGLKSLKNILNKKDFSSQLKNISIIESKYDSLIKKVNHNRNSFVAHVSLKKTGKKRTITDPNLSPKSLDYLNKKFSNPDSDYKYFKESLVANRCLQRYEFWDMKDDIPEIKNFLEEIFSVFNEITKEIYYSPAL